MGQADALCAEICRSDPAIHTAHYLRGLIAFQRGQTEQSIDHLKVAESLAPDDGSLKKTFAFILLAFGDHAGAAEKFAFVISKNPEILTASDTLSLAQLGEGLRQAGRLGAAIDFFAQSVRLQPEHNPATTGLFLCGQLACDWRDLERLEEGVEAQTQSSFEAGHCPVEDPFVHITRCMDSKANMEVARAWSEPLSKAASKAAATAYVDSVPSFPTRAESQPIRLGYLSSDLHEHATAYLMRRLFKMHDRKFFEVVAYSCSPGDGSAIRKKLESDCDSFRDINGWDADRAAALITADGIQILIDLKGHTRKNRLDIAARRPAPLQVTYLGFPGTSGARFFDYVIADPVVLPETDWPHYTECPFLMPHCYQINSHENAGEPLSRVAAGLPADGFVFCSFTNTYKIEPVMFERWMNILKAVPNSVLWLCPNSRLAAKNLQKEAVARGVAAERLIIAPFVDQNKHMGRLALADLALDTRVYNGHTTTSDAL